METSGKSAKLNQLLALPNETEWVEFKSAKTTYDVEKIGRYFSALSNEANLNGQDAGWLVFGVDKKHNVIGSEFRKNRTHLESLKHEISPHTALNLSFRNVHELHHEGGRVLLFEIPPAPHGVPMSWKGHYYGRNGESLVALNPAEYDTIRAQSKPDWTATIVEGATLDDLDHDAIHKARKNFKQKQVNLANLVDSWDDLTFLNKAKITRKNCITRTALLLLGKNEATHFMSPADVRISWVLKDGENRDVDYEHFGPPFLLSTEAAFEKIRNVTYRLMPDGTLFPLEIKKYDPWVARELIHNSIAHQDYSLQGRINLVEHEEYITISNLGSFIPQSVVRVIEADSPPDRYRNPFLAHAMVQLNMIDTIGSGIRQVFRKQRERGFPMPDYDLSNPEKVAVSVYGKIIDENYTLALLNDRSLDIHDAILLDHVQKRKPLSESQFKTLKQKKLIEGRRPNIYVSAKVARVTGGEAEYVLESGLEDSHFKGLVLKLIGEFGPASPDQINKLLMPKLPDILEDKQKKAKIKNLIQEMSKTDESIQNIGKRGRGARWALNK